MTMKGSLRGSLEDMKLFGVWVEKPIQLHISKKKKAVVLYANFKKAFTGDRDCGQVCGGYPRFLVETLTLQGSP